MQKGLHQKKYYEKLLEDSLKKCYKSIPVEWTVEPDEIEELSSDCYYYYILQIALKSSTLPSLWCLGMMWHFNMRALLRNFIVSIFRIPIYIIKNRVTWKTHNIFDKAVCINPYEASQEPGNLALNSHQGVRHYRFLSTWFRIFVESLLDSKILGLIPVIPVYQIWKFVAWLTIYGGITKFYKNINESSDSRIFPAFDVIRNQCRTPRFPLSCW